jgi:hypothetical protein
MYEYVQNMLIILKYQSQQEMTELDYPFLNEVQS